LKEEEEGEEGEEEEAMFMTQIWSKHRPVTLWIHQEQRKSWFFEKISQKKHYWL